MGDRKSTELARLRRCFPKLMAYGGVLGSVEKAVTNASGEMPGGWWSSLAKVLAEAILAEDRGHIPLGETVPALWNAGDLDIAMAPQAGLGLGWLVPVAWDRRAINRLRMRDCTRWRDLAALTPHDLASMPYAGHKTVYEIVWQALTFAWDSDEFDTAARDVEVAAPHDEGMSEAGRSPWASQVMNFEWGEFEDEDLQTLCSWAFAEKRARSLTDLVRLVASPEDVWPDDVRALVKRLGQVSLKQPDPNVDPILLANDWFQAQDDRARDLIRFRLFTTGKQATLDEIARAYGVSRERIRQLESQLLVDHERWIKAAELRAVRWRAATIRDYVGQWCVIDAKLSALVAHDGSGEDALDSPTAAILLNLAGPYRRSGQCLSRSGFTLPPIEAVASEAGLVDFNAYRKLLTDVGVLPVWHQAAIQTQAPAIRELNGSQYLWNGGLASKAVAVLASIGQPSSADTIADVFGSGMTANRVRNALSTDQRIMRSGKGVWALVEWGFEEYSGIAEEIRERLEAVGGGPLALRALVDELVDAFGVSESSVRIYAEAPAFVVADGTIRVRTTEDPYPVFTDLRRVRGIYVEGTALIAHLTLDAAVIRNGSCYVHRIVAGRLGVAPGDRLTFRWAGSPVQLHWPLTSPNGPLLTGLRPVFDEHGVKPGDLLRLRLDPQEGRVTSERVDEEALRGMDQVGRLRALTGLSLQGARDIEEQVAAAIEVQTSRVRDALRDRADGVVGASIPFRVMTGAANDELAAIFGDLDGDLGLG